MTSASLFQIKYSRFSVLSLWVCLILPSPRQKAKTLFMYVPPCQHHLRSHYCLALAYDTPRSPPWIRLTSDATAVRRAASMLL